MAFTYFFRDFQTLDMIREYVLPVIGSRRYINIWSAGCAMGQEPYTIAIILRENMGPGFSDRPGRGRSTWPNHKKRHSP